MSRIRSGLCSAAIHQHSLLPVERKRKGNGAKANGGDTEEIKLATLNYPRANVPAQSLLFAGMERYALLEWIFFRLLGDKSPFSQQSSQGDGMDRDEETGRIQYLAEIAKFLGITITIDTEAIQEEMMKHPREF